MFNSTYTCNGHKISESTSASFLIFCIIVFENSYKAALFHTGSDVNPSGQVLWLTIWEIGVSGLIWKLSGLLYLVIKRLECLLGIVACLYLDKNFPVFPSRTIIFPDCGSERCNLERLRYKISIARIKEKSIFTLILQKNFLPSTYLQHCHQIFDISQWCSGNFLNK